MGERIKELRKNLKLTQQAFADQLKIKRGTLASYEIGRNEPIDAVIALICKTFSVNEQWLRTGQGEMFAKTPETIMGQLAQEFGLDDFLQSVVYEYLCLEEPKRKLVRDFIYRIASNANAITTTVDTATETKAEPSEPVGNSDKLPASEPVLTTDLVARLDTLERKNAALERETEQARQENAELRQKIQAMEEEDAQRDIISDLYTSLSGSLSWKKPNKGPPST